jgi:hypothetical protein
MAIEDVQMAIFTYSTAEFDTAERRGGACLASKMGKARKGKIYLIEIRGLALKLPQ